MPVAAGDPPCVEDVLPMAVVRGGPVVDDERECREENACQVWPDAGEVRQRGMSRKEEGKRPQGEYEYARSSGLASAQSSV